MSKSVFVSFCDCEYQKLKISFLSLDLFSLTFKNIFLSLLRGDRSAAPHRSATGNRLSVVHECLSTGKGEGLCPYTSQSTRGRSHRRPFSAASTWREWHAGDDTTRACDASSSRADQPRSISLFSSRMGRVGREVRREGAAVINTTPGRGV